jgi:glutathione peroxidase-family protein
MNYGVTFPMMDKVSVKGMTWFIINFDSESKEWITRLKVEWNFQST